MFSPFRLKQPIGEEFNMDLDDSLNTKKALANLGHMKVPDHGLTEYPDRPMLDGVKSFQREQGLAVDGVMKPDGPTIKRLNETLEKKQASPPKSIFGPPRVNSNPKPAIQTLPATPQVRAGAVKKTMERRADDPPAVVTPFGGKSPSTVRASPSFQPINLKRPITPATNVDLDDTGRVKKALHELGLLDTRDHGLDEFPDQPMIDGIKAFQRQNGLREDGEMKPNGETAHRLNQVMAERDSGKADNKTSSKDDAGTRIAMAPAAAVAAPLLGAAARAVLGQAGRAAAGGAAVGTTGALTGDTPKDDQKTNKPNQNQRISPAPKMPPPPGIEPPDEKLPDRTENLPQPVELPDLSQPLPKHDKPTIFVLPAPKPGEFGDGIVERKGNEATRKELERIRDYFEQVKGWEHVAGGRYSPRHEDVQKGRKKAGEEQEERHIPGPGTAFDKGDSRPGGHFTDLTFIDERGRTIHIQSVDVDKNGKPTRRELNNAERIRRAEKNTDVFLIPKGAQLKRNRKFGE